MALNILYFGMHNGKMAKIITSALLGHCVIQVDVVKSLEDNQAYSKQSTNPNHCNEIMQFFPQLSHMREGSPCYVET